MNNNKFSNNKYNINNKIIPLFNVPLTMKKRFELNSNTNLELNKKTESKEANLINSQEEGGSFGQIANININRSTQKNLNKTINSITTVLNKYTYKLSAYFIEQLTNLSISSKTSVSKALINNTLYVQNIKAIEIIKDNYNYKLNNEYKNFVYLTKIHLPKILYTNSLFKLGIFLPLYFLKPQILLKKYKKYFVANELPSPSTNFSSFSSLAGKEVGVNKKMKNKLSCAAASGNKKKSSFTSVNKKAKGKYGLIKNLSKINTPFLKNLVKNFFSWTKLSGNIQEKASVSNPAFLRAIVLQGKSKTAVSPFSERNVFNSPAALGGKKKQLNLKKTSSLGQKELLLYWQSTEVKKILTNIITKGDLLLLELNSIIKKKELKQMASYGRMGASENIFNNKENNCNNVEKTTASPSYFADSSFSCFPFGVNNNNPVVNQYLKSMSVYNMKKKGILIYFNNLVDYKFVEGSLGYINKLIFKIQNLLQASFKSMYCLISKPLFIITPDKITIKIFYFLLLPNFLKYKKFLNSSSYGKATYNKWNKNSKNMKQKKKQINKFRKLKKNIKINLIKLSNVGLTKVFYNKFKILSLILSKLFKKPVEFDLTRLHYPYNDSTILVNLLGIMINKIKLRIIIRRLFEKAVIKNLSRGSVKNKISSSSYAVNAEEKNIVNIPAFLSGIKIKVGGRLLTQSVIPRKSVKITQRGATQRGKINFLDVARYTRKNKRGAFSITIKSGQNIF